MPVTVRHRPEHGIEHPVELSTDVLGKEPKHKVTMFLKESVLLAVPTIGLGICEVLGPIQLDDQHRRRTEKIYFHGGLAPKWNGELLVDAKATGGCRQ